MSPETNSELGKILGLAREHEEWRKGCLNLVAAENRMSRLARSMLSTDLAQRYGDYTGRDLRARRYFGTRFIAELEVEVARLAEEVFGARFVELRPISGHVAGDTLLMALCRPGDLVLELSRLAGGHRLAYKLAQSPLLNLKVDFYPFDAQRFNVDVEGTLEMVARTRPRLIILGASNFLFPAPVVELAEGLKAYPDTILVYDASHVLGLIAGGEFQRPLEEGAQIVLGGTQKSFPGPQGGVIYSNDEKLIEPVSGVVHPALLSNHHPAHLLCLGVVLLEMKFWGRDYARQVISNAQALASALVEEGLTLVGYSGLYTQSHTVLINTATLGDNEQLGSRLDEAGIIVSSARLPEELGGASLRLGTNEITRCGAEPHQMKDVARLVADVTFSRRPIRAVENDVRALALSEFTREKFTWEKVPDWGNLIK